MFKVLKYLTTKAHLIYDEDEKLFLLRAYIKFKIIKYTL